MATQTNENNEYILYCNNCDFKCRYKSDYNRHILTAKHTKTTKKATSGNNCKQPESYVCDCGRAYLHRASLYKHKKKCNDDHKLAENSPPPENRIVHESIYSPPPPENRIVHEPINESMVIKCFQMMMETQAERDEARDKVLAEHVADQTAAQAAQAEAHAAAAAEQTRLLIEAISLKGPQCITNHNNTTNNQFNLNVFLNEDCKDAYTLKEVMDSIVCTVSDLDRMDNDGYVATITRKILESIQDMDITERPIHCTDARRNTVCVKNETGWEKNEKAMKLLANSVLLIGRKLGRMVDDWRLVYPDHFRGTVTRREQYHRLIADIMKVNDLDVEARIASKICKSIVLDRKAVMER